MFCLGILEVMVFISGMLSYLSSGWLINKIGYKVLYMIIFLFYIFVLFYVVLKFLELRVRYLMENFNVKVFSL